MKKDTKKTDTISSVTNPDDGPSLASRLSHLETLIARTESVLELARMSIYNSDVASSLPVELDALDVVAGLNREAMHELMRVVRQTNPLYDATDTTEGSAAAEGAEVIDMFDALKKSVVPPKDGPRK